MKAPAELLLDGVEWQVVPPPENVSDGTPYATHHGVLKLGDLELECVVLNTGQRVFTGKVIEELIRGLTGELP